MQITVPACPVDSSVSSYFVYYTQATLCLWHGMEFVCIYLSRYSGDVLYRFSKKNGTTKYKKEKK